MKTDYAQWEENKHIAKQRNETPHDKSETGKAWEAVLEKEKEFSQERAKRLFDKRKGVDEELIKSSDNTFSTLRTQAFISGAVLTLASLKQDLGYNSETFNRRVDTWIECWNIALKANSKRAYLFDRKQTQSFLKLPRLESPFSVYFRYVLLELMSISESEELQDGEKQSIARLLNKARKLYLVELISQQEKALRRAEPSLKLEARNAKAKEQAEALLRDLCKIWFNIKKDDFNTWLLSSPAVEPNLEMIPSEEDEHLSIDDEEVTDGGESVVLEE